MALAMDIVRSHSSSRPYAYTDSLPCGLLQASAEEEQLCFFEPQQSAGVHHQGSLLVEPGSPSLTAERGGWGSRARHHQNSAAFYASPPGSCCRMDADVKLLSGSKRSCEGFTSLQDEAEADDASMVSGRGSMGLCRSASIKSSGIKRVCSVASADAIDSHCPAHLLQQQHQHAHLSVMIPVPGSCGNLCAADVPAAPAAKRSSKTGSSSVSSQEHGSPAATATTPAGGTAGPAASTAAQLHEAASFVMPGGRKLAPIKTSVAPKAPRMRLGGRLLLPEEAQKHLQAVAAAAAAASAGRSLSRAQSPSVTCRTTTTSSPAGPNNYSSMSGLSAGCGGGGHGTAAKAAAAAAPCNSAGHSSGGMYGGSTLPQHGVVKLSAPLAPAAGHRGPLGGLPENFIPTPEGVGTWLTLASTMEGDSGPSGATSPLVCSSYTELLLAQDVDDAPTAAAANRAARQQNNSRVVSAFAAPSSEPWPLPQQLQQPRAVPMLLSSAGSFSGPNTNLSSSCPVHIPVQQQQPHSSWAHSKLLQGSISGSNGSSNTHNSLAASLASAPGHASTLAAQESSAAAETDLSELLDSWAPPQQRKSPPVMGLLGGVNVTVANGGGAAGSSGGGAAATWKPAFAPAAPAAGAGVGGVIGMVPAPGLSAVGSAPVLTALPQQHQQLHRSKSSTSRTKRHSKASKAPPAPALPQALPQQQQQQQQQQQMVVVTEGGRQVVLSQQELMTVLQQNMAASFASGYMMASNMQTGGGGGQQQQPVTQPMQPPLLKPVASVGAFNMPPAAVSTPPPDAAAAHTTAAAAVALGSSNDIPRMVGHGVDDILPSLQELLTDCY